MGGDYRIELLSERGEIALRLYEGWEQDAANEHALRTTIDETADSSWRTVLVRSDEGPAAY